MLTSGFIILVLWIQILNEGKDICDIDDIAVQQLKAEVYVFKFGIA